jgi:LmbE family N-acetylglucosaminyl deacetylase
MLSLLDGLPDRPLTILCLGAHSDDIEIGCGGTVLRLLSERPGSRVHWIVFSADDRREEEARASAADFLREAGAHDIAVEHYRESYFPYIGDQIKDRFEVLKSGIHPDVVLTHRRDDDHQDHRTIGQLTWNSFRDHLIAEYEIPKYEGDLGHPNLYVPLTELQANRKVELLMKHFGSQRSRAWFTPETFRGLMAVRGIECNAPAGWAESHIVRKLVI